MSKSMPRLARFAFPLAIAGFLGFLYFRTLAPGLTWAHDGADGGDLITAAATGGVPHPTGYPTYLLIASAFLKIPLGSLAYRTSMLSSLCMIGASLMIYLIVVKVGRSKLSALIAGMAFGTFPLVWSQAVITEVNALHALFITAILCFAVLGAARPLHDLAGGVLAGLGLGNHVSTILALPLLALGGRSLQWSGDGEEEKLALAGWKSVARRAIGLLMGLSVYLIIPLRAANGAAVNWGKATTWEGFWWLVSGRAYWERLGHFDRNYLWTAFRGWSHFLISQVDLVGLLLIFVALGLVLKRSRLHIATGWLAAVYSVFAVLYYSPDSYVYLIPVLVSISIWIGLGSGWLVDRAGRIDPVLRPVVGAAVLGVFMMRALLNVPVMDLSKDRTADNFAQDTLQRAPRAAILLAKGDESTFALWYRHLAYQERPDVEVISANLLPQTWYGDVLARTSPSLSVSVRPSLEDWMHANPGRPVCYVDLQTGLICPN